MEYFKEKFKDTDFDRSNNRGEVKVICPFHDDTKPSANIDVNKSTFYWYVCQKGMSEAQFLADIEGYDRFEAEAVLAEWEGTVNKDWDLNQRASLWANQEFLAKLMDEFKISTSTINSLRLGLARIDNTLMLAIKPTQRYNVR
mgnify:FL=1